MKSLPLACRTILICGLFLTIGVSGAFAQTKPSAGGAQVFDVRSFGAVGDGQTLDTAAFAKAIQAAGAAGGGTVLVSPGRYLIGAIELASHVRLCVDGGATVLASQRADDYPLVENVWMPARQLISPLIYAHDAEDITISGRGTIDGQGASWWQPILAAKARRRAALVGATTRPATAPSSALPDAVPGLPRGRPQLIGFLRCSNVVIEGVTLLNSPQWNIHPLLCERVRIDGVTITAHVPSPNTDGINPESCRGVQILNCRIDNGDDCVTLKSGADEPGRRLGRPDEDITIANCIMYHGHGGVTIGSEMSGGVRNVTVANCIFHGTDNGIRIKSQRGRGGVVEGIVVDNVVMQDVPHPFVITAFYSGKDTLEQVSPVDDGTPRLRDILISNVTARGAADAGAITGLREMPISDVTFTNVHVQSRLGFTCTNSTAIRFNDCIFDVTDKPALITNNCTNIESDRLQTPKPAPGEPAALNSNP
jgi:polygalacturonase